jgi:hypothetical protein
MNAVSKPWRIGLLCFLGVAGLFAAYIVGWTLYLDHKLKPLLADPAVRIVAGSYQLIPVPASRTIDVGYATFLLPVTVDGDPVRAGSSNFVVIVPKIAGSSLKTGSVTAFPPKFDQDEQGRRLWADYNKNFGGTVRNWFEWRTEVLAVRPFSAWEILRIGKREAVRRAILLAMKGQMFGRAKAVSVGESNGLSFIVAMMSEPAVVDLTVENLALGCGQEFWIDAKRGDVPAIISSIVGSYKPHPNGSSEEAIRRQIDELHLRTLD